MGEPRVPRDNPFEPLPPERLAGVYRWPAEALRFLAGEADCLHIVGEAGLGKTALLRQLQLRLEAQGAAAPYACVPPDGSLTSDRAPLGMVTLLDEADRWPDRHLRRLVGRVRAAGQRLALASHRDHRRLLQRAGLTALHLALVPLSRADEAKRLFEERVALAAGSASPPFVLDTEAAEVLLRLSGGNLERCLQIGYEVCEDLGRHGRPGPGGSPTAVIGGEEVRGAAEALERALADG